MIYVSGRGDDEVTKRKLARVKSERSFVIERRNCFSCAFDRSPERLIRKVRGVEEFAEQLVRRVLDHLHLFEDDFLFPFEVFLVETRARNEVGEQIHRLRHGSVRNLCGEACHLMGRISVQVAPEPIRFHGYIARSCGAAYP